MSDDAGRGAPSADDDPAHSEPGGGVRAAEREPGDLGHLLLSLALVGVAVAAAFAARDISGRSATWPWMLVTILLVLTLWEASVRARQMLVARRTTPADTARGTTSGLTPSTGARRRTLYAGWLLGFAVTGLTAGFGWATLAFLPIYQWAAGSRSIVRIIAVTAGVVLAFHLLFDELAGVPLW
jgi:hypothetical protein